MSDTVIRVENVSKLYRLGEVGTGSLAHDVNRWWHKVRGKEDPYLKIGEVNDRTKPAKQARTDGGSLRTDGTTKGTNDYENLTTDCSDEHGYGTSGGNQRADSGEFLEGHSQAGLQMDSKKPASIRSANASSATGSQNGSDSESAKISKFDSLDPSRLALRADLGSLHLAPAPVLDCGKKSDNSAPPPSDWVYALKDVSFEVKRGEVLGIIGRNGAGKSTLLKILSRVTTQSEGRIKVKGRIASLLEVGTGFHPELTGRENIFLNGAILGMRKAEIARKFDEIVEFSGCARYIDTPVKRYSSGMYVRLAFAVAAHLEPEILIVDEVLAVGDAEFQKKCLGKMKDVAGHGRTILFVSHNMAAVNKLCANSLLLDQGRIAMFDRTERVLPSYLRFGAKDTGIREWEKPAKGDFWMRSIRIIGNDGEPSGMVDMRHGFSLELDYEVLASIPKFRLALRFVVSDGTIAFTAADCSHSSFETKEYSKGVYKTKCHIPGNLLNEGTYNITLSADIPHVTLLFLEESALAFTVEQTGGINSKFNEKWPGVICPYLEWQTDKIFC